MDLWLLEHPCMKFLSMKISNFAVVAKQSEAIHKNFITKISFSGQIQQTMKILGYIATVYSLQFAVPINCKQHSKLLS